MKSLDDSVRRIAEAGARYWQVLLKYEPEICALVGLPIEWLPTRGHAETISRASEVRRIVDRVADLDPAQVTGVDADTLRCLRFLADSADGAAKHFWLTPAGTPYQNYFLSGYGRVVFSTYSFAATADVERYLDLAVQYARCFDALAETLKGQAKREVFIAKPAIRSAVGAIKGLRDSAAQALNVNGARLRALDTASVGRLTDGIIEILDREVYPAVDRVLTILDAPDYSDRAPHCVGLAAYPGGEAAYRFFVRRDTSLDAAPEDMHRLGLEQCEQLGERMSEVRTSLGFNCDEAEFRRVVKTRSHLYANSPGEVEARYLAYMLRLEPLIDTYFSALPSARYGVARLEENLEAGMTFGYYEAPTPAQPVGRYRYNGSTLADRSLLTAAALIYHELAPGHHFQIARQYENSQLPDFRRYSLEFGAFNEGWAEYASGLGWEMGLYEEPWDAYGRLSHERFMAARLALDTALNCGWWTLDEAFTFMRHNVSESETQIRSEVLRYATDMPAQALGYRAGFLAITRMRRAAESREGRHFRLREFHEAVLSGGAMPFTALDARLTRELPATSERGPGHA